MMRHDTLNWHNYVGYAEMNALSLNVIPTDKDESKRIIVHNTSYQSPVAKNVQKKDANWSL